MSILDLLRKKKLEPSASTAEIREALDKVHDELPAARKAYEAAELRRDDLVLDGTDEEREAAELEASKLERLWRDLDVARAKLSERLDEAERREQAEDLDRRANRVAEQVARQAELIREALPVATRLAEIAKEYNLITLAVTSERKALGEANWERPKTLAQTIEPEFDGQVIGNPFAALVIPGFFPEAGGRNPMRLGEMAKRLANRGAK